MFTYVIHIINLVGSRLGVLLLQKYITEVRINLKTRNNKTQNEYARTVTLAHSLFILFVQKACMRYNEMIN